MPAAIWRAIRSKLSVPAMLRSLRSPIRLCRYLFQRSEYLAMPGAELHWSMRWVPMLEDDLLAQDARNSYYYQDTWGARKVFEIRPSHVVDVGCTVLFTGIISQFVPTISIDIRPVRSALPGLTNAKGDITKLDFADETVECIVTLCVIEHIGLGRYGDELDPMGATRAATELARVIRPGGNLVISALVGPPCLAFNAHRVFSVDEFVGMFPGFDLVEDVYLYPEPGPRDRLVDIPIGQGVFGCFHFRKGDVSGA